MIKKLQQSEEVYIQFTPEELAEHGLKIGDKFSCKIEENSIILKKYAEIELDMSEYPREVLMHLIAESVEQDISVNEVIEQVIASYIDQHNE